MIYLQKGLRNNKLAEINTDSSDWQWLIKQMAIKAPLVNSIEKANRYKQNQAEFIITGKLEGQQRNDTSLKNRSIIFFDIDDTNGDDYKDSVNRIESVLKEIAHLIYPTISNGYKGTRLRVAIPTDQSFNADQRDKMGSYLVDLLPKNWQTDLTSYRSNWSQLAGMSVLNAYSLERNDQPIINYIAEFLILKKIPVQDNVIIMSPLNKQATSPIGQPVRPDRQSWQDITNNALTSLANPPETNRHTYYSSLVGSLLFMKTDPSVIKTLLFWSNSHSNNPLPYNELQRTIHSVSRTAERK
ncbi:primase C-terminal domain-containing protein [Oenococcus oeni]|uniref:primase C-terminal domain-containing protein n=1 Tax=Oenococcus oeni TaxID=1247 RepID=UPI00050E0C88|nr:primase C-terminal domain-containing protein [Oenococcus oeni]KGH99991.1 hypothetical protein X293_09605 [Oenococcus oeni IOEB_C52]